MAISALALVRLLGALGVFVAGASSLRNRRRRPEGDEPDIEPNRPGGLDLRGTHVDRRVDLSSLDLREADLSRSRHRRSDLDGHDLTAASLARSCWDESSLRGVHLDGADLSWASLRRCDLRGATFDGACLVEVDLSGAQLESADLSGARSYASATWRGAVADVETRWPPGFVPADAEVVIR